MYKMASLLSAKSRETLISVATPFEAWLAFGSLGVKASTDVVIITSTANKAVAPKKVIANLLLLVGWFYADPTILSNSSKMDWGGISLMLGLGLLIAVREKNRKAKAIQIWKCYCSRCGAEGRSDLSGLCLDCERIFIEKIVSAMANNNVTKVQL